MTGEEPAQGDDAGGWPARLPVGARRELVQRVVAFSRLSAEVSDTARVVDLEAQFLDEDPAGAIEHLAAQAGHLRRAARSQDLMAAELEAVAALLREYLPPPPTS